MNIFLCNYSGTKLAVRAGWKAGLPAAPSTLDPNRIVLGNRDFGAWLSHKDGVIGGPLKGDTNSFFIYILCLCFSLSVSCVCVYVCVSIIQEHSEKVVSATWKTVLTSPWLYQHLDFRCQSPELKERNICCSSHQVCRWVREMRRNRERESSKQVGGSASALRM